jgi:gas vesicle protein
MNRAIGFLAGLGAGVSLGMIFAPRSGVRTRLLIQRRATDGADYLRQCGSEVRSAASEAIRDSTRRVTKGSEAVRAAMEAGRQAFTESIHS